ncbi:MAG: hypothetical protein ABIO70_22240 [Pseudomonadota bacterium]
MQIETSLLIPGPWKSREQVAAAMAGLPASDGPRYRVDGEHLVQVTSGESVLWSWGPPAEGSRRGFELAGRGAFEPAELDAIAACGGVVVLVDSDSGSPEAARRLLAFGEAVIRAGGLAVMVESAGLAHTGSAWRDLAAEAAEPEALLLAFVIPIGDPEDGYFTCGMHNLGLPDVLLPPVLEPEESGDLLDAFTFYMLAEEPTLEEGDAFAPAEDAPAWILERRDCEHFEEDSPLFNPFGLWLLLPEDDEEGEE